MSAGSRAGVREQAVRPWGTGRLRRSNIDRDDLAWEGWVLVQNQSSDQSAAVEWRRLGRYLWAGTGATGPVGTIEQGRRFLAIDTAGDVVGRCRTLCEAQALLQQSVQLPARARALATRAA